MAITRRKFLTEAGKILAAGAVGATGAALIKGSGKDEKSEQTPKSPTPKAPAPTPNAPATKSINEGVDEMITGGTDSITGFANVPKAIEEMTAALKTTPDLQNDPQFMLRFGGLHGLRGCLRWGDTNITAAENELRVDGIAYLNRALELDPSIANKPLWGHQFNEWYQGMRDTAVYKARYRGEIGRLRVKVESDGSLKINK